MLPLGANQWKWELADQRHITLNWDVVEAPDMVDIRDLNPDWDQLDAREKDERRHALRESLGQVESESGGKFHIEITY